MCTSTLRASVVLSLFVVSGFDGVFKEATNGQ